MPSPRLILGPMVRNVTADGATVWLEADSSCEATVRVPGRERSSATFAIEGRHYALIELDGLPARRCHEYEVLLDDRRVWPEPESRFPSSAITPLPDKAPVSITLGSCRISLPHEPPYVLSQDEDPEGHGIDALRSFALRAAEQAPDGLPSCLLLLGDQIYADQLSPAMRERVPNRSQPDELAADELIDFEEYAEAYVEAWSEPAIRWLLSTVPSVMIFDDHEIRGEWKISEGWLQEMRAETRYPRQVPDGLMAYWIYQHIGNLGLDELKENELLRRVRSQQDAGGLLRDEMTAADCQAGHSRWSYRRDLGRTRLVVIDSRAGRELEPGARRMIGEGEWEWVVDSCRGDFDHLLLASSVPFFLAPGLHLAEAWNEAVADGAWGSAAAAGAEWIRREAVMDHWAAFQRSFAALQDLLESLVQGRLGTPPRSVILLSGDVHHCHVAEVGFPHGVRAAEASGDRGPTPVWQVVCSGLRKQLEPRERRAIAFGTSRAGAALARALARSAGVRPSRLGWRLVDGPAYDNQIATLTATSDQATVVIETTAGADWRSPGLRTAIERKLA